MESLPVVLVVDDDADHRLNLVNILEAHGFPCAAAPPDGTVLDFAARVRPDLVLLRHRDSEARPSPLLVELRRALPKARVALFVSLIDVPAALT